MQRAATRWRFGLLPLGHLRDPPRCETLEQHLVLHVVRALQGSKGGGVNGAGLDRREEEGHGTLTAIRIPLLRVQSSQPSSGQSCRCTTSPFGGSSDSGRRHSGVSSSSPGGGMSPCAWKCRDRRRPGRGAICSQLVESVEQQVPLPRCLPGPGLPASAPAQ